MRGDTAALLQSSWYHLFEQDSKQLGDCWLMTALACLAEHPGAIQRVFLTDQFNPRGTAGTCCGFTAES